LPINPSLSFSRTIEVGNGQSRPISGMRLEEYQ
jgi:hypothetical protein